MISSNWRTVSRPREKSSRRAETFTRVRDRPRAQLATKAVTRFDRVANSLVWLVDVPSIREPRSKINERARETDILSA